MQKSLRDKLQDMFLSLGIFFAAIGLSVSLASLVFLDVHAAILSLAISAPGLLFAMFAMGVMKSGGQYG